MPRHIISSYDKCISITNVHNVKNNKEEMNDNMEQKWGKMPIYYISM